MAAHGTRTFVVCTRYTIDLKSLGRRRRIGEAYEQPGDSQSQGSKGIELYSLSLLHDRR